jgi:CBS domain containing-hemolysin-like protein
LEKPFYVPDNTDGRTLLHRFNEEDQQLAIVVNEYGSTSGLITREDLIEVVIGEIADSRDEKKLYTQASDKEIIASGKLELDDFNDLFNSRFESETNRVTIGGWLTEKLGEIPKNGTKVELEGYLFHVLSAEPNRIKRLYIRKLK